MARGDSQRAIGAVTKLLRDHLSRQGFNIGVGRPDEALTSSSAAKLNLFLYELSFDGPMRNVALEEGRPPPVWLVLRYLLTAFDESDLSDSPEAHELLGRGLMALNDLNFLRLDGAVALEVREALEMNPEPLKITFEDAGSELLSRLMQGAEETYRLSAAVQVRPVLLMPAAPEPSDLLVGVDYSRSPPLRIGQEGIGLAVTPSLGPVLDLVEPVSAQPGDSVTVQGRELHLAGLEAWLGPAQLRIEAQAPDRLRIGLAGFPPGAIAAGEHPLSLRVPLPGGRWRGSNLIGLRLRPLISGAALAGPDLVISGEALGNAESEILLTLLEDGKVVRVLGEAQTVPDQRSLTFAGIGAFGPGRYLAMLRVNGQQALTAPLVVVP